jgi:ABC-type multidrug transport system fused ATPase/permease subunit
MLIADVSFGQVLLVVLEVFVFFAWLMVLFSILGDLFRDDSVSGWGKAGWCFFLIFVPFLAALIYVISRGQGMRERTIKAQQEAQSQMDSYIKQTAGGASTADEIDKLAKLRDAGTITAEEFEAQKVRLLA